MRGILETSILLHTAEDVVAIPAGSQVDVISDEDWYHDIQDADIQEAVRLLGEDTYSNVCSFWIDTDGYTDRDRLMFVCGVEFEMLSRLLPDWSGSRPIHRENESRIRMLCGHLGIQCTIEPHQDYDGCETWSELEVLNDSGL